MSLFAQSGYGKSFFAKNVLLPNYDRYVFHDIKRENFDIEHDIIVGTPEELSKAINRHSKILYQPEPTEEEKDITEDFNQVCRIIFQNSQNTKKSNCLYVDEAMSVTSASKITYWHKTIITMGRSFGVANINASQRPISVNNFLISQSDHIFTSYLALDGDREKLAGIIGEDAANEIRYLPKFHFIYYNVELHKLYFIYYNVELHKLEHWRPTLDEYLTLRG